MFSWKNERDVAEFADVANRAPPTFQTRRASPAPCFQSKSHLFQSFWVLEVCQAGPHSVLPAADGAARAHNVLLVDALQIRQVAHAHVTELRRVGLVDADILRLSRNVEMLMLRLCRFAWSCHSRLSVLAGLRMRVTTLRLRHLRERLEFTNFPRAVKVGFNWSRAAMLNENSAEETGLSSAGAFIDTAGEKRKKRKKIPVKVSENFSDKEEEELEALVFGKLLFKPAETSGDSDSGESEAGSRDDSENEEDVEKWGRRGVGGDKPAWRDEDDDEMRYVAVGLLKLTLSLSLSLSLLHPHTVWT